MPYTDDEARDERGRWTAGGASGAVTKISPVMPRGVRMGADPTKGVSVTLLRLADGYRARAGITSAPLPRVETVDPKAGALMARAYENLKNDPTNPEVRAAYRAFVAETHAQMEALKAAGYTYTFVDKDPYHNSAEMLTDLRQNHHLDVFASEAPHPVMTDKEHAVFQAVHDTLGRAVAAEQLHPVMTNAENDEFRAVHDSLGHGVYANQFGPKGEENAYRAHAALYSPAALRVMATETRGQNSWFNFGPYAGKPLSERPFAEQKAALWPKQLLGGYGDMYRLARHHAVVKR